MIRCLAEQKLEFSNGTEKAQTKLGFCELPNWVGETPYFQAAERQGLIRAFEGNNPQTSEEVLKAAEQLAAIKAEIKAAEEKRDLINTQNQIAYTAPTDAEETQEPVTVEEVAVKGKK